MTETQKLSIEEVRSLVAERQRYSDWLTALEGRKAETPVRVFERVQADYSGRRKDVGLRLRSHLGALSAMADDLDTRLGSLEGTLGTLEDERAEAMLRTAVGEFDGERWEQVRQQVEAQIAALGEQRSELATESDEVRALLDSVRAANDEADAADRVPVAAIAPPVAIPPVVAEPVPMVAAVVVDRIDVSTGHVVGDDEPMRDVMTGDSLVGHSVSAQILVDSGLVEAPTVVSLHTAQPTVDEMADLDNALAMFSTDTSTSGYAPSKPTPRSLNGIDVFDDAELGDLRMDPPVKATAVATPLSVPTLAHDGQRAPTQQADAASAASRDGGFDDLAFLRSVVEPTGSAGANRTLSTGDQLKTLRCTECGTMNLPTEWYCERCGGELAAF